MAISVTRLIRQYHIGPDSQFVFKKANFLDISNIFDTSLIKKTGLYIHIPFCKSMCPYCPYNRIKYDKNLTEPYLKAMLQEIEIYYKNLKKIEISSIYIGGGTPTNLIDELGVIIKKVKELFNVTGNICIETNPSDINEEIINKLIDYGVDLISIGAQSFNDKYLKLIGRNYDSETLYKAIDLSLSSGFKSVNLDLMFALPSESLEEVLEDLEKAIKTGAKQLTVYPLFTFPYSQAGKYLKLKKIRMPDIFLRRKMYKAINNTCLSNGFNRVSVWGFKKENALRYSSVTRENYIGLGASAGSFVESMFYFNTFSVDEYIKTCLEDRLPVAIKMDFTDSMRKYFWLYWELYNTYISKAQLNKIFNNRDKLWPFLKLAKILRLYEENNEEIFLTERGAFWIHLLQNYYALNYINKIWSIMMKEAWPERIAL